MTAQPLPPLNLLRVWQPRSQLAQQVLQCEPLAAMLERGAAPRQVDQLLSEQAEQMSALQTREFVHRLLQLCVRPEPELGHIDAYRSHWLHWLAQKGHFSWHFEVTVLINGDFALPQELHTEMWQLEAPDGSSLQHAMRCSHISQIGKDFARRRLMSLPLMACVWSESKLVMPAEGEVRLHLPMSTPQKYKVVGGLAQRDDNGSMESIGSNSQLARRLVFAFVQRV